MTSTSVVRSLVAVLAGLTLAPAAHAALPADFTVTTTLDQLDAAPGDGICATGSGTCSLRAAVQEANALARPIVIDLKAGATYELRLAGAGEDAALTGDLDVTGDIVIQGFGATYDARSVDRAFDVRPGGALTVEDVTVTGGLVTAANGGAFRSTSADLRLHGVVVTASVAVGALASGGAVMNDMGFLEVMDSVLSGNTAERAGGAIEANLGDTVVMASELADNVTGAGPGNGGALHLTGAGTVLVSASSIHDNTASLEGGGLWNSAAGIMTVETSVISNNIANGALLDNGGGGLYNDGGYLEVRESTVSGNVALVGSGSGGGILNNLGQLVLTNVGVDGNSAARAGGGVESNIGTTTITGGSLSFNSTGAAPGNGGGLHLTGAGTVDIHGAVVEDNTASAEGGGVWNSSTGTMNLVGVGVRRNVASGAASDQGGGGVYNDGGTVVVDACIVTNNAADGAAGSGGGMLNNLGSLTVIDSVISKNTAVRAGGGVEANVGDTYLYTVLLESNATGANPGNGGAVHLTGAGYVEIDDARLRKNSATNEGGGLWNSSTGTMVGTAVTFFQNSAPIGMGKNVYNDGGTMTVNAMVVP